MIQSMLIQQNLAEKNEEELDALFNLLAFRDPNQVFIRDLKETLLTLGPQSRLTTLFRLLSHHSPKKTLDRSEFKQIMTTKLSDNQERENLLLVFSLLSGGKGFIDEPGVKRVGRELGEQLSDLRAQKMVELTAGEAEGRVGAEAFFEFMTTPVHEIDRLRLKK